MRLDRMNAVAIGADRCLPISLGDGLSVNALLKFRRDRVVALAARQRNIELEDRRLGIFGVENLVRPVAVGADSGLLRSVRDGVSVHALLVGSDHLRALSAIRHDEFLAVASAAGCRNIGMVNLRLRIARWQKFVRAAVAIDTGRCMRVSALRGFGVEAAIVGGLLVSVARSACDLLRSRLVRGRLHVGMAIHAGKHAAVNRVFECLGIDVEAYGLSILIVRQGSIAVAGETFICSGFGRLFFRRGEKGSSG